MSNKIIIGVVVIVVLVAAGFFIFKPSKTALEESVQVTGETKEFTMEAFQFGFEPSVIEVNKGDRVKITATSRDVPHGFAILELGVRETINPGEVTNIEFAADKAGTFSFFCSVPCGAGHSSMRGQLIVR